jgi:LPS sulfotransferase NodH
MDGSAYLEANEQRMSWIMGSSRSGSTWLLRMLAELRQVTGVDDPHLGHHLGVWRPVPIAWAAAETRPELTTLAELKHSETDFFFNDRYRDAWMPALRDLIRARFGAQLAETAEVDESHLVVKEPGSHSAGMIFEAFPSSRLIFLLRDGRDVVDSWMDAYQSGSWAIEGGAFPVAEHGRRALVEWLASVWAYRVRKVGEAFHERPREARILVRYEDLLAEPVRELGRILATLGIEISDDDLHAIAERNVFSKVDADDRGSLREIRAADPGGWQRNLSPTERRVMDEIMGPDLEAWGYRRAGTRKPRAA